METNAQCPWAQALACSLEVGLGLEPPPPEATGTLVNTALIHSHQARRTGAQGGLLFLPWHAQRDTGKGSQRVLWVTSLQPVGRKTTPGWSFRWPEALE